MSNLKTHTIALNNVQIQETDPGVYTLTVDITAEDVENTQHNYTSIPEPYLSSIKREISSSVKKYIRLAAKDGLI